MKKSDIQFAKTIDVRLIPSLKLLPITLYRSTIDLLYNWVQLLLVILPAELYFNKQTFVSYPIRKIYPISNIWEGLLAILILLLVIYLINIAWSLINDKLEYRAMEYVFQEQQIKKVEKVIQIKEPEFKFKKVDKKFFNNNTRAYTTNRIISILSFLLIILPMILPVYFLDGFALLSKLGYTGVGIYLLFYTLLFVVFFQLSSIFHPIIRPYEYLFAGYFEKEVVYSLATQGMKDLMGFVYGYKEGTNIRKGFLFVFVNISLVLYSLNNANIIYPILTFVIFYIVYFVMDYSVWNKNILAVMTSLNYKSLTKSKEEAEKELKIYTKSSSEVSGAKKNLKKRYKLMKNFMGGKDYSDFY